MLVRRVERQDGDERAQERAHEALQGAQTSLADELAQIEPALAKLQALPEAWAQWMTAAQKNVDVGFDRVEEARTHPALVSPATRP